ncbi:MAG: CatB-related O-acetyltransferase [Anaeromyxobacter sp.]
MKRWLRRLFGWLFVMLRGAYLSGSYHELIARGTVRVGRHTYGVPQVHTWRNGSKLIIGSYTSIADEVHVLLGGNHPTTWVTTFPMKIRLGLPGAYDDGVPFTKGDVTIGHDVWIGHGVTILSGTTIGNGAVVVARSVVVKDVEPYTIYGGVPARKLRQRFSDEQVRALQEIRWWEWTDDEVRRLEPLLSSEDVGAFLEACRAPKGDRKR